jgi:hypothetical protein
MASRKDSGRSGPIEASRAISTRSRESSKYAAKSNVAGSSPEDGTLSGLVAAADMVSAVLKEFSQAEGFKPPNQIIPMQPDGVDTRPPQC